MRPLAALLLLPLAFIQVVVYAAEVRAPEATLAEPPHSAIVHQNRISPETFEDLSLLNQPRTILSADVGRLPLTGCGQTEVLCPGCPVYDMLDWLTLDPDLRATSHMYGTHDFYTTVQSDHITYTKNAIGDTWDIDLYDSNNIYGWITEWLWNDPTYYKRSANNTNVIFTPRFPHGGYPGTRVVSCNTNYVVVRNCVDDPYFHNSGIAVNEIWGPYDVTPGWGNIGQQTIVKVVGFYGCTGTSSDTCSNAETTWFSQRYGEIRWAHFVNSGGIFVQDNASEFFWILPGTGAFYFPCGLPPH